MLCKITTILWCWALVFHSKLLTGGQLGQTFAEFESMIMVGWELGQSTLIPRGHASNLSCCLLKLYVPATSCAPKKSLAQTMDVLVTEGATCHVQIYDANHH